MAKEPKTLDDLFHDTLKDIYFAEKKILATLPKMEKAAQASELKKAFKKHHTETRRSHRPSRKSIRGHRQEAAGQEVRRRSSASPTRAPRSWKNTRARPHSMPAYSRPPKRSSTTKSHATARCKTWAEELGLKDAVRLLDQTLQEEKKTDATLTEIAESVVNQEAEAA